MPSPDPRRIITPDALTVAPELHGRPLARPWRRAAAMAIDGVFIALLANATAVIFGLAAVAALFRASAGSAATGIVHRSARLSLRLVGVVILLIVAIGGWQSIRSAGDRDERPPGLAGEVVELRGAESENEARAAARRLAERLRSEGLDDTEVVEVVRAVTTGSDAPAIRAEWARAGTGATDRRAAPGTDTIARAYADAVERSDDSAAAVLRGNLAAAVAADTIAALSGRVGGLESGNERLAAELETARDGGGFRAWVRDAANELGLSFGWAILYFTVFLTVWSGRTPGKRLFGIRVLRLTGEPITWRVAFDRAGGYTASAATALIGFARILWDPNRQAMHDKVVDTVVVRD